MTWKIPLAKPFFDDAERDAVKNVLESGMVSSGQVTEEFESVVKKYTGAKYCVAVSSCTAGLHLVLNMISPIRRSRIAITAFTFPAVQSIVDYEGGQVTNIDVERDTYNISPRDLERNLFGVDVIVGTDMFGLPCDRDKLEQIAHEKDIPIVYDAACSLGSEYEGERIGKNGTNIFSFHCRKIACTGEAGVIVTNDDEIAEKVICGRQHGRDKKGNFAGIGLNYKISNVTAAIGIAQIEKLPTILRERNRVADTYWDAITQMNSAPYVMGPIYSGSCVWIPGYGNENALGSTKTNWQSYVVRLQGVNRDAVMHKMRAAGIEVQIGARDNSNGSCPISKELSMSTLALPIYPQMTSEEIKKVVEELEKCFT